MQSKEANVLNQTLTELTAEQENSLESNLVWIFASPRSGTSWLAMRLLSHNTLLVNEPLIGKHLGSLPYRNVDAIVRDYEVRNDDPQYFFSRQYESVWKKYVRKLILNRIYAQVQTYDKHVIIKEPNGSMGADILSQCLPTCKIILILRDGRDVIDSMLDYSKFTPWGKKVQQHSFKETDRETFIERAAHTWLKNMEVLERTKTIHDQERLFLIRYEDLRYNTLQVVLKLYNFIGIDISREEAAYIVEKHSYENVPALKKGRDKPIRTATPGAWREHLTEKEQNIIHDIIGAKLKALGYETS